MKYSDQPICHITIKIIFLPHSNAQFELLQISSVSPTMYWGEGVWAEICMSVVFKGYQQAILLSSSLREESIQYRGKLEKAHLAAVQK